MAKRKKRAFRKYIKQDTYFTILREARPLRNRKIIKLFGVRLIHKIKLDKEDIYTLNRIQKWMDRALRPIEVWKPPKSRDSKSILIHLIKYLYARYEMPDFMINVWFEKASQYQFWFLELGKGANIRNLDIPLAYTKKMSHFFMEAPADLSVGHALRWGQILGMGGDDHLAREILKGRLGESFKDDTFWSTVIQFFINQSDLDINLINRVITYIHTQKFEPRRYYINENEHVDEPPPHPGFSMKGRTLTALLNEMRTRGYLNWRKSYLEINKIWPGFPVPDYDVPSADEDENVYCRIEQITTARDLFYEGMMMRHCVASYKYNCVTQKLSIWSYRQYQDDKFQRLLTLAIDSQGKLLEVKGKHNSAPKRKELRIIREWLDSESFHGLKTYND